MKEFQLLSSNQFYLPMEGLNKKRFLHIATVGHNVREFIFFIDTLKGLSYVEEITGGTLSVIEDDNLWADITSYIQSMGLNKFLGAT